MTPSRSRAIRLPILLLLAAGLALLLRSRQRPDATPPPPTTTGPPPPLATPLTLPGHPSAPPVARRKGAPPALRGVSGVFGGELDRLVEELSREPFQVAAMGATQGRALGDGGVSSRSTWRTT